MLWLSRNASHRLANNRRMCVHHISISLAASRAMAPTRDIPAIRYNAMRRNWRERAILSLNHTQRVLAMD
ncbi:MAG: hypothetical protein C0183_05070 [Roseiflexus castenholzii]|nr:MAG: hypothetical protein C0183_05070 [Roseiflexus castenholzii]